MKRSLTSVLALATLALAAPALIADVKTTEKTTMKVEGFMGGMVSRMAGGADGITSTVAVKGTRMLRSDGSTAGEIVDLAEQKVYALDLKKKEYKVITFAQKRAEMEKLKADMDKQMAGMRQEPPPSQPGAPEYEIEIKVDQTGQTKTLAGQSAREVLLVLTLHEKGKTLEQSGGFVMTNQLWIAPRVPALDELQTFQMKYFEAVYGGLFTSADMQQAAMLSSLLPGFSKMAERMQAESKKLDGTALATVTTVETVKSAEQMQQTAQQQQNRGGGGLMGRIMGGRGGGGATEQRTKTLTTTHEYLSIATSVAEADTAVPAGFREKK